MAGGGLVVVGGPCPRGGYLSIYKRGNQKELVTNLTLNCCWVHVAKSK